MGSNSEVDLARIDERQQEIKADIAELRNEMNRTRTRLHNLEGFAQMYLDSQRVNRQREEAQYRRMANAIQVGGLVMAVAMVALTVVTILIH